MKKYTDNQKEIRQIAPYLIITLFIFLGVIVLAAKGLLIFLETL